MSMTDSRDLVDELPATDQVGSDVGSRLRRRRRALSLTLKDVAEQSGLTQGFISQVERGYSNASVRALQEICSVLKLNVGDLFNAQEESSPNTVQRFRDAQGFSFGNGATKLKLTPANFDHLEMLMGMFEPGGSTGDRQYTHGDSEESLLVLAGDVIVTIGDDTYELGEFDSLHYHSSQPHQVVEATGTASARVLWTMSPPTY